MLNRTTITLSVICVLMSVVVAGLLATGEGRLLALVVYLGAVVSAVLAVWSIRTDSTPGESRPWIDRQDLPLIGAVALLQIIGLLYMQTFPFHYVQDEFITGYTTYTLPSITEIEWFAGYPAPGQWIAGFPILYYALQWPFIEIFGLSLETIRVSTWPYHVLTAILVYLLGKEFFRCRPWAVLAAAVYVLLAPNLYMAGYGMHNISSTFAFLAAFYAAVRMLRGGHRIWIVLCGLFSVAAYLTYTSSYLTLPLIAVFIGLTALFARNWLPVIRFGQVMAIAVVGLVPFLTHALTQHNYFTQRGDQVNAISAFYDNEESANPTAELATHFRTNIESLYTPGIGGVTDYWFGHQSLFDWLTLALLIAGLGIAIARGVRDRDALELSAVVVVLATFIFGMLLTLPAGGFHRTTLAFPFIALLIALTTRTIAEGLPWVSVRPRLQLSGVAVVLLGFILINISTLQTMTREDERISGLTDSVPITAFIEDAVQPDSEVIVSSFPNYHLERELIVRTGDAYDVRIEPFEEAVEHAEDTIIILFQPPSDQTHRLEARYGDGEFVESHDGHVLERHLIWVPETIANH